MLMQVNERLQNLVEEALRLFLRQWLVTILSHVLLEVKFQVFKHEVELLL